MRDAQKPDHVSLNTLIGRLKEGRFVIHDFQREFEWEPWDIKDLMRSILLDYYIGSLLLWKGKKENFNSLSCKIINGFDNKTGQLSWDYGLGNPEHIVFDGQLAELRNGIRHSRTVDEITRKEGEAAVLWFGEVLSK